MTPLGAVTGKTLESRTQNLDFKSKINLKFLILLGVNYKFHLIT